MDSSWPRETCDITLILRAHKRNYKIFLLCSVVRPAADMYTTTRTSRQYLTLSNPYLCQHATPCRKTCQKVNLHRTSKILQKGMAAFYLNLWHGKSDKVGKTTIIIRYFLLLWKSQRAVDCFWYQLYFWYCDVGNNGNVFFQSFRKVVNKTCTILNLRTTKLYIWRTSRILSHKVANSISITNFISYSESDIGRSGQYPLPLSVSFIQS